MKLAWLIAALLLSTALPAVAQNIQQSGNVTPGHLATWATNGVVRDAGTSASGNITSLGVVGSGSLICQNSGPTTAAYQRICMNATATSGGLTLDSLGGAPTATLTFTVNGVPLTPTTAVLPTTSGNVSCFSNTSGSLTSCGETGSGLVVRQTSGTIITPTISLPTITSPTITGGTGNFTGLAINGVPVGTSTDTYWSVVSGANIAYTAGNVSANTPANGTNTTQLATTAFVRLVNEFDPYNNIFTVKTSSVNRFNIDASGNVMVNNPVVATTLASTFGIALNPISTSSYFTMEGLTPNVVTIDTTGSGGGSTIAHSAWWDVAAYDSAGVYHDGAFKINPGWSYSDANHMQSDVDMVGYIDGKGIIGLLVYASGCVKPSGTASTGNTGCTVYTNPSFNPVPDSLSAAPVSSVQQAITVTGTSNNGGKVELTMASTAQFSGVVDGMPCFVSGVLGTVEANGIHQCVVTDGTHLTESDQAFTNAWAAGGTQKVSIMNPTDLGASTNNWNDFWVGGNVYQAVGSGFSAGLAGYTTFAQNSPNQSSRVGSAIRQYVNGSEGFRIQTYAAGTELGTITNTALAIKTNGVLKWAFSAAGGFSVNSLTDPGAGSLLLKPKAFADTIACGPTYEGNMASITDSSTVTWGNTITGGSSNHVLGYCDGTNWTVMGK